MTRYRPGDRVQIWSYPGMSVPKEGTGTVVYIFKANVIPDPELVQRYYQMETFNRFFKHACKKVDVDRVVILRDEAISFFIVPDPLEKVLLTRTI